MPHTAYRRQCFIAGASSRYAFRAWSHIAFRINLQPGNEPGDNPYLEASPVPYPACLADRMAWRLALGLACSLHQIPLTLHVAGVGLRLTDTQTECKFSVQQGVSEIDVAGSIEPIEKANTVQTTFPPLDF